MGREVKEADIVVYDDEMCMRPLVLVECKKQEVSEAEFQQAINQAHEALWVGGQLNPSEAFDELDKLIFCKIWDERKPRKMGEPYDFQIITVSKHEEKDERKRHLIENENLYKRITALYEEGRKRDAEVFRDNIRLSNVAFINPGSPYRNKATDTPISFIPMEMIDEVYSEVSCQGETNIEGASGFTKFKEGDLLWAKITPCMQNGKSAIARNLTNGLGCGSTEFFVLRPKDDILSVEYLHVILHMNCVRKTAMLYFGGSAGQQRVSVSFLENFDLHIGISAPRLKKILDEFMEFPPIVDKLIVKSFFHVDRVKRHYKRIIDERRLRFIRESE